MIATGGGRGRIWRFQAVIALAAMAAAAAPSAVAAGLRAGEQADLRRAIAVVGASTSEQPALRQEKLTREPSPAYMLGAALGAWIGAAAQLDFDLKTPSGDGDDSEAIGIDCFDERTAFDHLEARSQALGLAPRDVVEAAGLGGGPVLSAWREREAGPAKRCR
jgi:hypothetical protein